MSITLSQVISYSIAIKQLKFQYSRTQVRALSQDDRGGPGTRAVNMFTKLISGRNTFLDRRFRSCMVKYLSEMVFEQVSV